MLADYELLSLAREMGLVANKLHNVARDTRLALDDSDGPLEKNLDTELRRRRNRRSVFGEATFCDPLWEILISLLASSLSGRQSFVTEICVASGAPMTSALRYLHSLIELGWIERRYDLEDRRRVAIDLTPAGIALMRRYFLNPCGGSS